MCTCCCSASFIKQLLFAKTKAVASQMWGMKCWDIQQVLHAICCFVLALLCWGVPSMQFYLPQFYLLVPWAPAVFPKLIWCLGMNTGLTHVSDIQNEKVMSIPLPLTWTTDQQRTEGGGDRSILWDFFDISVIGQCVLAVVYLLLSP